MEGLFIFKGTKVLKVFFINPTGLTGHTQGLCPCGTPTLRL